MRIHLHVFCLLGASLASTLTATAQAPAGPSHQEVDLAITYSAQRNRLTDGTNFWRQGGALELSAQMGHGLGAAMNLSGSRVSNINGTGVDLTTFTTTFGPRYTWISPSSRIAIFGQGLIGESHGLDSVFPAPQGAEKNFNTFALQVGGGLDLRVKPHMALRLIQADWIRTQFPNGATNVQNELRLSAGIVFRLRR
jgi:peptidoglycan-associated lipoprotein